MAEMLVLLWMLVVFSADNTVHSSVLGWQPPSSCTVTQEPADEPALAASCPANSRRWRCCSQTGDVPVTSPIVHCVNGTWRRGRCVAAENVALGRVATHPKLGDDNLGTGVPVAANRPVSVDLGRPVLVYAVVVHSHEMTRKGASRMRVWVELRLRSDADVNVTGDCVWAGGTLALNRLVFYCLNTAEETGLLGHRVRLGVDQTIVLAEVQVHEYSDVTCGDPGVDCTSGAVFAPMQTSYAVGSRIHYTCGQFRPVLIGSGERTCDHSGRWSGVIPRCVPEVVVVQDELLAAEPLAPLLLDGDGQCRLITGALSLTFKKPLVIYRIHLQSQVSDSFHEVCRLNATPAEPVLGNITFQGSSVDIFYELIKGKSIKRIAFECSKPVKLCNISITKAKDSEGPQTCPSQPDSPANGRFNFSLIGVEYWCQPGYKSSNPSPFRRPNQCNGHTGQWSSAPPYCQKTYCAYPAEVNGSVWTLLNASTVHGSLIEYRRPSLEKGKPTVDHQICQSGQWSPYRSLDDVPVHQVSSHRHASVYAAGIALVLVSVVAAVLVHQRRRVRRCCRRCECCVDATATSTASSVAYRNDAAVTEDVLDHIYESVSEMGSLADVRDQRPTLQVSCETVPFTVL